MPGDAAGRRELVHEPARDTGRTLLGALRQASQFQRWPVEAQRQRQRHFERGARREPGTDREGARHGADQTVRSGYLRDDAGDIAAPVRFDVARLADREGQPDRVPLVGGSQFDAIAGAHAADGGAEVDRHREGQAAGVVGVVAHQVDATRRERGDLHVDVRPAAVGLRRHRGRPG